jgi:hypothetical protein
MGKVDHKDSLEQKSSPIFDDWTAFYCKLKNIFNYLVTITLVTHFPERSTYTPLGK